MPDALFVKSKVREYVKSKDCNTSASVLDNDGKLNLAIIDVLDKAIARAKANGRKTLKGRDL